MKVGYWSVNENGTNTINFLIQFGPRPRIRLNNVSLILSKTSRKGKR